MLQMLIKEMSYFSYKLLVFFLSLFIHSGLMHALTSTPPSLCFSLSVHGNERQTVSFDYSDTLGVGYRESVCDVTWPCCET